MERSALLKFTSPAVRTIEHNWRRNNDFSYFLVVPIGTFATLISRLIDSIVAVGFFGLAAALPIA
jgi:hypothetical protein